MGNIYTDGDISNISGDISNITSFVDPYIPCIFSNSQIDRYIEDQGPHIMGDHGLINQGYGG